MLYELLNVWIERKNYRKQIDGKIDRQGRQIERYIYIQKDRKINRLIYRQINKIECWLD